MNKPKCIVCGNEFENTCRTSKKEYLKRKYCSRNCANKDTVSKRFTLEMRQNLSEAHKGKIFTETHKHNISKSLKNSEEAKKYQFKTGEQNPAYGRNQKGPLNPNWKGGVTSSNQKSRNDPKLKVWRQEVFERDKFTCQHCGAKGFLHAHHIIPFSEDLSKAFDVENGITVCVKCHENIHGRHIGKFKQSS
jgi:predicted HNH restriction endonuclease